MNAFQKMRQSLIGRGLLTEDFKVTPAGEAWTIEQMAQLREARAKPLPKDKRIIDWSKRWDRPWWDRKAA